MDDLVKKKTINANDSHCLVHTELITVNLSLDRCLKKVYIISHRTKHKCYAIIDAEYSYFEGCGSFSAYQQSSFARLGTGMISPFLSGVGDRFYHNIPYFLIFLYCLRFLYCVLFHPNYERWQVFTRNPARSRPRIRHRRR